MTLTIAPHTLPAPPAENTPAPKVVACPELLALMATRRSSKPFTLAAPGPDPEQLTAILTLAARSPDHGKLAPWRFVVIAGEGQTRLGTQLAALKQADGITDEAVLAAEAQRFARAPLVVAVVSKAAAHPKIPEWEQILSAGAVCYGLLLAAQGFGFGGVWLSDWPAYDPRAMALLGLGEGERIAGFIHLGTQTEPSPERTRPDVADLVTWL
jgi:nitroreductase